MPKLIDPKSGERKFYKGPGRNKDRNLGLYEDPRDRAIEKALWRKVDKQRQHESKLNTARKKIQEQWKLRDEHMRAEQELIKQTQELEMLAQQEQIKQENEAIVKRAAYRQLLTNPWFIELSFVFKSQNQGIPLEDLILAIAQQWPTPNDLKATKAATIGRWLEKRGHKGGLSGHMITIAKKMIAGDNNGTATA